MTECEVSPALFEKIKSWAEAIIQHFDGQKITITSALDRVTEISAINQEIAKSTVEFSLSRHEIDRLLYEELRKKSGYDPKQKNLNPIADREQNSSYLRESITTAGTPSEQVYTLTDEQPMNSDVRVKLSARTPLYFTGRNSMGDTVRSRLYLPNQTAIGVQDILRIEEDGERRRVYLVGDTYYFIAQKGDLINSKD